MSPPIWIVPTDPGDVSAHGPRIEVNVTQTLEILVHRFGGAAPDNLVPLFPLESLIACQLGQALQDASRWCGAERARRDAKGRTR